MDTNRPAPRRIGVLGGMGPAAAIDLQARILALTPASRDEDHIPVVCWNVPQVPPRVPAILSGGPSPLPALLEGVRALEAAGAEAIAIACNTAHHWADDLRAAMGVPLIDIGEATVREIGHLPRPPRLAALAATRGTLASGFFARRLDAAGIPWIAPDEAAQALLDEAIAAVKSGDAPSGGRLLALAAGTMHQRGADLLVAACTELPLAARALPPAIALVDTTQALARAVVDFARAPRAPGD